MTGEEKEKYLNAINKAEFIESLKEKMDEADRVVAVFVKDRDDGAYDIQPLLYGIDHSYKAVGILHVAALDLCVED